MLVLVSTRQRGPRLLDASLGTIVPPRGDGADSGRRFATAAQSRDEELMNSITHGLGLVLSIAGLSALVTLAGNIGTTRYTVGCGVYETSLVMLTAASTLLTIAGRPDSRVEAGLSCPGPHRDLRPDRRDVHTDGPVRFAGAIRLVVSDSGLGLCLDRELRPRSRPHQPIERRLFDAVLGDGRYVRDVGPAARSEPYLLAKARGCWQAVSSVWPGRSCYFNHEKRFYHSIWHLFVLAGSICHYRVVLGCVITATF